MVEFLNLLILVITSIVILSGKAHLLVAVLLRAKVSLGIRLLLIEARLLLLLLREDALLLRNVLLLLLLLLRVGGEELKGQADRLVPQSWTCKSGNSDISKAIVNILTHIKNSCTLNSV